MSVIFYRRTIEGQRWLVALIISLGSEAAKFLIAIMIIRTVNFAMCVANAFARLFICGEESTCLTLCFALRGKWMAVIVASCSLEVKCLNF